MSVSINPTYVIFSPDSAHNDGDVIITSITRTGNDIAFTVNLAPTNSHTFVENEILNVGFTITYTDSKGDSG